MKTKIILIVVTVIQLVGFTVPAAECVRVISKTQRKTQAARLQKTISNNVVRIINARPPEQQPAQRDMAAFLGVTEQKMSAMLHNNVNYSPFDVLRLAEFFNVDPSDLLNGEDGNHPSRSDAAKNVHVANIKTAIAVVTAKLPGINPIRALNIAATATAGLASNTPSSPEVVEKVVSQYIISKI